jgi:uncharacterized membrane protein
VNFETSKYLGGIGAILMFIGIIPFISVYGIMELVGAILVVIAMKGFADYYREAGIFNNTLYAIVMAIVGAAAFIGIAFVALVDFFTSLGITLNAGTASDWASQFSGIDWTNIGFNSVAKFAGFIFLDLVVLFVFMLITAILLRKALKLLSAKTGVGLFGSTGTVLLVGAVLVIVFGLGLLLIWISVLLLAIAFFQIKPPQPQAAAPPQYAAPPAPPT